MDARLVLAVAVLAAAPVAAWAALAATDATPDRFATVAVHDGDAAMYAIQSASGEAVGSLRLRWLGPHEVQAADGSRSTGFAVDVLADLDGDAVAAHRVFVGADGVPVAWSEELRNETLAFFGAVVSDGEGEVIVAGPAVAGANHVESRLATRTRFAAAGGGQGPLLCGVTHSFQGREQATAAPRLAGDCGAGATRVLGQGAAGSRHGKALVVGSDEVRVWLHASSAFPIQVERRAGADGDPDDGWTRYLLVSSTSGGQEISWSPDPLPAVEAPTVALGPRQPWGPVEADVSHPLPLSVAYDIARTAIDFPDLRDFLASHPGAYTSAAEFTVIDEADRRNERWEFEVSDGRETLVVLVATPGPAFAIPIGGSIGYGSHAMQSWDVETTAPPREQAPLTLPTVAGLRDLWAGYAGGDGDGGLPLAWSFRIACADEDCTAVDTWAAAGVGRLSTATPAVLLNSPVQASVAPMQWEGQVARVAAGPDGQLRFRYDSTYQVSRSVLPADVDPQGTPAALQAPTRDLPSPLVLASTAVLAVAFALAAKVAFAALFTRIRTSQLLENPLRARLMDLVQAEPGLHYQALQARSGIARGTLDHHLRKLVDGGLLRRLQAQGFVCYFPTGTDSDLVLAAPALKAAAARRVLRDIGAHPGVTASQIATAMAIEPSTVGHHVERLMDAGLVHRVRSGKAYALHLTARGGKALLAQAPDDGMVVAGT